MWENATTFFFFLHTEVKSEKLAQYSGRVYVTVDTHQQASTYPVCVQASEVVRRGVKVPTKWVSGQFL